MYSVLIVDDEHYAVEAIQCAIGWEALGITVTYTANSMAQAQEAFKQHAIDIMLCDIEMPQGSGLDLLGWVREHYPATAAIILTCHADFHYAKQAIQMGGLDYILKPIPYAELSAAIGKAILQIRKDTESSENGGYRLLWQKYQPILVERFWEDLLDQTIPSRPEAIRDAARSRNIPFDSQMRFVPIYIGIHSWNKSLGLRDRKILLYALKNVAEELLLSKEGYSGHLIESEHGLIAILTSDQPQSASDFKPDCLSFIAISDDKFYCNLSCYLGADVLAHELFAQVETLKAMHLHNVAYEKKVFSIQEQTTVNISLRVPDMGTWSVMLLGGTKEKLLQEVEAFLAEAAQTGGVTSTLLRQFYQDFVQMVYSALQQKGIHAHQLFADTESSGLADAAFRSLTSMVTCVRHMVDRATDYLIESSKAESVVKKVSDYVTRHLNEELSRDVIAAHIFLNPDYLNRLFKKETGLTLVEFVTQERVKRVKELLARTHLSVSVIADSVGYRNFSNFSQMFKKQTGMNPLEYRQTYTDAALQDKPHAQSL